MRNMRYRRRITSAIALFSLLMACPAMAQVRSTIFGPGIKRYPIAVSPLKYLSGARAEGPEEFAETLARDLELSGLFRVIPRDLYLEMPETSGVTVTTINFDNWSVIGALALVKGTLQRHGEEVSVEVRLFDVVQRRQRAGRRFRGKITDLRRMAQRFADEVLAVNTGERGPFDSRIVFLSTRAGRFKDVHAMSADGTGVWRITAGNTLNLSPSWMPDGNSLILTSYRAGNPDLFSIDLLGERWKRLSSLGGLNLGGRWAPDGSRLAVTLEYEGNPEIAILGPDGGLEKRLTNHWAIDVSPSWSPDGKRIAFCSNRSGSPQIHVMDSEGGSIRRLSPAGSYNTSPSWSPKGDRIAYTGRVDGRFQIFTVSADGTDVHQVTDAPGDNEDASWSPDGRYLVFSSTRAGPAKLYLADRDGASQVQLTEGNGNDTSPAWSGWLD